jgi:radical SAM superfamily enzyme YgiQ (UPF0313 family)
MKIVICVSATHHSEAVLIQQPIGALYAGTVLKNMGHEVQIVDLRLKQECLPVDVDIIFVLTETYDRSQCYSLDLTGAKNAIDIMRYNYPKIPVVVVGVHGTIEPLITSRTLTADTILKGEIESAIPWFVEQSKTYYAFVSSLPPILDASLTDLAGLPPPEYSLIDVESYKGEVVRTQPRRVTISKSGLIYSNRGCPYPCEFCYVWPSKTMRWRPVSLVIEELRRQLSLGIEDFFFLDYTFTLNKDWVNELCREIIASELNIKWICQTRCECVDKELLSTMRSAGCQGIWYGIESPWIRKSNLSKPLSIADIERAIELTNYTNMQSFLFLLVGLGMNEQVAEGELITWLRQRDALFFAQPLIPRPGTRLWQKHVMSNMKLETWQDVQMISEMIARKSYWFPEMHEVLQALNKLPNHVDNIQ